MKYYAHLIICIALKTTMFQQNCYCCFCSMLHLLCTVGNVLWAVYQFIVFIVLLSVLRARMVNTYHRIFRRDHLCFSKTFYKFLHHRTVYFFIANCTFGKYLVHSQKSLWIYRISCTFVEQLVQFQDPMCSSNLNSVFYRIACAFPEPIMPLKKYCLLQINCAFVEPHVPM